MGSNEAGERRAGEEETLLRFPDGLIHPHTCTQTQTHAGTSACVLHTYSAKGGNYIAMYMGEYLRHKQINTNTNKRSLSQAAAIKCVLCVHV